MLTTINILAIESSCDDTSAAIISNGKILSNLTYNQKVHKELGGVVPELASRAHMEKIYPVVQSCLEEAGMTLIQKPFKPSRTEFFTSFIGLDKIWEKYLGID